ncbi:deoxyribonuclease, partial [Candidatus Woesearchaeota archaeon CG10_big_fil_rev_8_21_14_0_10_34_8]
MRDFQGNTAPVQVGEELDVTIEAVGEKGDGVAKKNGFVLFVPG